MNVDKITNHRISGLFVSCFWSEIVGIIAKLDGCMLLIAAVESGVQEHEKVFLRVTEQTFLTYKFYSSMNSFGCS
jgi:hypothetical protein